MSRFDALRTERMRPPESVVGELQSQVLGRTPARVGKKAVSGYFSLELSQTLNMLALERNTSLQAMLGEAIDDLLRKYGKHPFGER
jgi:hypothetical protein